MKLILLLSLLAAPAFADTMLIEDFSEGSDNRWRYTSDRVMGGVSDGSGAIGTEGETRFAQLRGTVSTANNGGFIQIRQALAQPLPEDATGLQLRVRGNGATYYIHMRPQSSRRPWQFLQAAFETSQTWETVSLPWSAFSPQGGLGADFTPQDITSLGIVAYGADYEALLDIDWIGTTRD